MRKLSSTEPGGAKTFARSALAWAGIAVVVIALTPLAAAVLLTSERAGRAFVKRWAGLAMKIAGVELEVRNLSGEDPPPKGAVYVSNHRSYIDVLSLLAGVEGGFRFVAKKSLLKLPGINVVLLAQRHFLIDRREKLSALKTMKNEAAGLLARGERILIFPEGGIHRGDGLGEFTDGAAAVAIWAGCPIMPVAISGSSEVMPATFWPVKPGKITLTIGPPIPADGMTLRDRKELTCRAKNWIEDNISRR